MRTPSTSGPSLDGYNLVEKMAFVSGWAPGRGRGRWPTWRAYLADYHRLRPELHARFRSGALAERGPLFADRALAFRKRHGAVALARASYRDLRYGEER